MQHAEAPQLPASTDWTRIKGEGAKPFAAFTRYRDMGPRERSTAKVARELGISKTLTDRWSGRHSWASRVRAFDDDQDARKRAAAAEELEKLARNNARIANLAQTRLHDRLKALVPAEIAAKDVPSWIRAIKDVERDMRGAPSYRVQLSGPNDGPVEVQHIIAAAAESLLSKLSNELESGETPALPGPADAG